MKVHWFHSWKFHINLIVYYGAVWAEWQQWVDDQIGGTFPMCFLNALHCIAMCLLTQQLHMN